MGRGGFYRADPLIHHYLTIRVREVPPNALKERWGKQKPRTKSAAAQSLINAKVGESKVNKKSYEKIIVIVISQRLGIYGGENKCRD